MNFIIMRKLTRFILHCRLEDVMAAACSTMLLIFFLTKRVFHTFNLNGHDFIFILLPAGVLAVKCLLGQMFVADSESGANLGTGKFLVSFFRPLAGLFRDWFPLLLLSVCYYALYNNVILRVNATTADAMLSHLDAKLFGNQVSLLLEPWINPWATDFFNFIYFSYVFSLPVVAVYFYLDADKSTFRRVMMGYLTLMLMAIVSYLLVPAIGPGSFFADQYTRNLSGHAMSRGVDYIISKGRVGYDCFPSLHVGIPVLLSIYLFQHRRKLFIPAVVYVAVMCCATIYLRYHYVVDVLASFLYAPAACWLNDFMLSRWPGERVLAAARPVLKPSALPNVEPT